MLEIKRILGTELSGKMVNQIVNWLNDPVLMKYSEQRHRKHTIATQNAYIHRLELQDDLYAVASIDDVLIGTVTATIDRDNNIADVGILVGSQHIGKGYGCEVWRTFCAQLAKDGIRKIEAGCMSQNKPMLRIFEKNHMRLEGTRRYHFKLGKNEYDDMALYGKLT